MDDVIIVTVSYWYRGKGWIDPRTQIEFKGDQKGLPITISKSKDLTGIKRSIILNNLILLEGNLGEPGVANLEKIDPAELSPEQLEKLAGSGSRNNEELEKKIKELEEEKKAINKELTDLKSESKTDKEKITKLESDLKLVNEELTTTKGKLTIAESDLVNEKTNTSNEVKSHKKTKDAMFKIHIFTTEELADAYFTATILKEIMTVKGIEFEASDNKAQLTEKLIAGEVTE